MDSNLIKDLESCAERLMEEHMYEAQVICALIGILKRTHLSRVEEIENGILKDLEHYYRDKITKKEKIPYDEKLAGMCPPEWDPNHPSDHLTTDLG